jgi:AmpD protein
MKINRNFIEQLPHHHLNNYSIGVDGWCINAIKFASPNFGTRPECTKITLLVIHNISLPLGQFEGDHVIDLFLNQLSIQAHPSFESLQGLQVSTHFFIKRDGRVYQFVSCLDRAWHAGISQFQDQDGCNDYSIGIELEGSDNSPFEIAQYNSLHELSLALLFQYPIENVVGHNEIAPDRKTDPGPYFDWCRYQQKLESN